VQPGKVASDSTNQAGQNAAGASGVSDSSLNLSNGATVAIIVVECLVVLGGGEQVFVQGVKVCSPIDSKSACSAVLFYLAKKRQWAVRDSLRRSVRRPIGRDRPRTPNTGDSTRRKPESEVWIDPPSGKVRSQQEDEKTSILEED